MSNGDDADEADAGDEESPGELSPDSLSGRLDDAEDALADAETENDLDAVEETLDEIAADLPEPDDEDEEDPVADLESRLEDLRGQLEDARGPYAEDVTEQLETAESTITDSEWTEDGEGEVATAVETVLDAAGDALGDSFELDDADLAAIADSVATARTAVAETDLDADEDSETIEALLEAANALADDLEAAEEWSDLTVREQLDAQGFYDVLSPENRKDFPPEWNAIKLYATEGEPEPILTALESYESDFMEDNILDALERFAPAEAFDAMNARAERRNKHAIRILGKIGDDRACDTITEFLGGGDVELELVTLRALGAVGSEESTQPVADRLAAENPEIRSTAARALGMIGDTRAIDPLADRLEADDADEVRASAAWALRQIGTADALDIAAEYADDRAYIVQAEAEKATGA
jgi:hypothetical protein